MNATFTAPSATEKQIAYIESLVHKLTTMEIRSSRLCPDSAIPAMRKQDAEFAAEVMTKLPTMGKFQASAYISDLISMTR